MSLSLVEQAHSVMNIVRQSEPIISSDQSPISLDTLMALVVETQEQRALLVNAQAWSEMVADQSLRDYIDPVTKWEVLMAGRVGTISGMAVYSDMHQQDRFAQHPIALYKV